VRTDLHDVGGLLIGLLRGVRICNII
jgi:hypothetical protein